MILQNLYLQDFFYVCISPEYTDSGIYSSGRLRRASPVGPLSDWQLLIVPILHYLIHV